MLALLACAPPDPATSRPSGDDPEDDPTATADTGGTVDLPLGDNVTRLGAWRAEGLFESIGVLPLGGDHALVCAGASPLAVFDLAGDPSPAAEVSLPAPAGGFRCQHLAATGDGRVLASHHGDETGASWIGLADVSDPAAPRGLDGWAGDLAFEGLAAAGDVAYAAVHEAGVVRIDLAGDVLGEPVPFGDVAGNAYALALGDDRLAVGTSDGTIELLDLDGARVGEVATSGPVFDLAWLADGSLIAACGAGGLDRVDVASLTVVAHADTRGSAFDAAVLADGSVAVAAWDELRVFDPTDLSLLGTEAAADPGEATMVLAVALAGETVVAGEWWGVETLAWDPGVAAPDVLVDRGTLDFGVVADGEEAGVSLLVRNEGRKPLTVDAIAASDPRVTVSPASLALAAGGEERVQLRWTGTPGELSATLTLSSDDPDEAEVAVAVRGNRPGVGVGDPLPDFTYVAFDDDEVYTSSDLGGPALLTYFATF